MPQVKVWNDNKHEYKENFREQKIVIPAGGFIEMEEGEAHLFKGTFSQPILDGDGNDTPAGYKMIRIEKISSHAAPAEEILRCIACQYKPQNAKDLDAHVKEMHSEQIVVDEVAEEAIKTRKKRNG